MKFLMFNKCQITPISIIKKGAFLKLGVFTNALTQYNQDSSITDLS